MRRIFLGVLVFGLMLSHVSCTPSGEEIDIDVKLLEIETILKTSGYVMDEQTWGYIFSYYNEEIYDRFGLEYDIYSLQYGYVNDDEREVILVCFLETEHAEIYSQKLLEEEGYDDRFVHQEGQVVIITYSQETIDLFD